MSGTSPVPGGQSIIMQSISPHTTSVQNCCTVPDITGPRHTTGDSSSSIRRFTLITLIPVLVSIGTIPPRGAASHIPWRPKDFGMEGPVISASSIAVLSPRRLSSTAESDVTSDFPTPPFPLTTPMSLFTLLNWFTGAKAGALLFSEQLAEQVEQSCVHSSDILKTP